MKVNTIFKQVLGPKLEWAHEPLKVEESKAATPAMVSPETVDSVIFPASERFQHMLSLIARDNPELYNRIVGLE